MSDHVVKSMSAVHRQIFELIVLWTSTLAYVLFSIDYAPKATFVVTQLSTNESARFLLGAPAVFILVLILGVVIVGKFNKFWNPDKTPLYLLALLFMYVAYVTILTGGMANSPFVAIAAFIPLVASDLLDINKRLDVLALYGIGVIILAGGSHLIPEIHPPVGDLRWFTPTNCYSDLVGGGGVLLGITTEIGLLQLRRHNSGG